jgi:RimJ/RimL family protein N-acetyltransferase
MGAFPQEISTPRLTLRSFGRTDAAALHLAFDESDAHLRPWIRLPDALPSIAVVEQRLARFQSWYRADERYHLAIVQRVNGFLLGSVILCPDEGGREMDVSYWLRHDQTGRGFAMEAVGAASEAAFHLPWIRRLNIFCQRKNFRAARVAARLGYVRAAEAGDIVRWERRRPPISAGTTETNGHSSSV